MHAISFTPLMSKNGQIEHEGVIHEIGENILKVHFIMESSCSGCHAKGVCNLEERNGEILEVKKKAHEVYEKGEKVKIVIRESLGLKAVLIAYLIPFMIVMVSLFTFVEILQNEIKAGIISLILLVPYYLLVYFYRSRIKKEIDFTIEKI